jgi:hypothetical protein
MNGRLEHRVCGLAFCEGYVSDMHWTCILIETKSALSFIV